MLSRDFHIDYALGKHFQDIDSEIEIKNSCEIYHLKL